jgi:hypothetical protein
MKSVLIVFFLGLHLSSTSYSANKVTGLKPVSVSTEAQLINQVLFEVSKEAFTTYDFKNYLKTKKELKVESLLPLVQNELQEFILYRLSLLEVRSLDLQLTQEERARITNVQYLDFLKVKKFLKLKEKHISQIDRYKNWTDILKRKHNYLSKIEELGTN